MVSTKSSEHEEIEFLTATQLGERLGVTERAVKRAVDSGRIHVAYVNEKGRRFFNEATARKEWARNTLPGKATGKKRVTSGDDADEAKIPMDANKARLLRDTAQAKILNIKARALEKQLVNAEEVAVAWERHVGESKRLFMTLPMELKMHIPTLTQDNIALIENRINAILETLSEWSPAE